jgi:hypothetical protein
MEYWKFKAIDKLKDYPAQKASIANLTEEISRLEMEACSIKSATGDGAPVKGGGSGKEERLLSNIVQREEYSLMRDRARLSVSMVERGLSILTPDEKHLLDKMYIDHDRGDVPRLMNELGLLEVSSLYKRVNKALRRFTVALFGCTEG